MSLFVSIDGDDGCRSESCCNKLSDVVRVFYDVNLLTADFINNCGNTAAVRTDACADRVNVCIVC